ncbi:MAG: GtrA family protein [Candidatus Kerfeldbacteria bacterium]|nr:GtrA family protein [Candidatus Kerfeldbacteria bacterium]
MAGWFNSTSRRSDLGFQAVRFVIVGVSGVGVDMGVYLVLTRGFAWWLAHFVLASTVSSLLAATNNFLWNRRWTFGSLQPAVIRQYFKYLLITGFNIGLVQLGLWLAVRQLGWYDLTAKLVVISLATAVYFLVLRQWVFKDARYLPFG